VLFAHVLNSSSFTVNFLGYGALPNCSKDFGNSCIFWTGLEAVSTMITLSKFFYACYSWFSLFILAGLFSILNTYIKAPPW